MFLFRVVLTILVFLTNHNLAPGIVLSVLVLTTLVFITNHNTEGRLPKGKCFTYFCF